MKKCDIIIPIYNAYECVEKCLESIIKNTDMKNYQIICIDDKSTDKKILPLLKKYEKKYSFIKVLVNEENLGFVGTVNKGMEYSENDVVLLNSDTEVSKNWLDKIIECAYSEKKIATVTPLSNNATLVSVPVGLQENDLPKNMSFDTYASLVEKCSYKENIELPTAHGFCMFIKREVLDILGFFDEETFGKGYGEENDFSFRCLDYGYKNIICDNVIIYHKEKQSFSSEREKLVEKHIEILKNKYPVYQNRIELWCQNFPINHICKNIRYAVNLHNRKNILIIIHDWHDIKNSMGGTSLHVRDLIENLREKYNFHVLTLDNGIYKLYSYFESQEEILDLEAIEYFNILPRYNQKYKKMLNNIVDALGINYIHVHHLVNHFFDIGDVIKEKKLNASITIHDLYPICPSINMLYKMESYCEIKKEKNCSECLKYKVGLQNDILLEWQKDWKELFSAFKMIITPSNDTKKRIEKVYPKLKIKVIEHGIDFSKNEDKKTLDNKKEFHIAFVGVVSVHKGGNILKKLIHMNTNSNLVIHQFGYSEFEELRKNKKNYFYHDKYKREELPKLLEENNIDLICSFSIWPETYSYTLTEEIACKVPVLAFDIGAVGDRIKTNKIGWTVPLETSSEKIYSKIKEILQNKEDYNQKIQNIEKYKIKTAKEMAEEYIEVYELSKNEVDYEKLKVLVKQSFKERETTNMSEYNWIVNSLRWKIASKIKIPSFAKKLIKNIMR